MRSTASTIVDEASDVPLSIRGIVAERLSRCSAHEARFASAAALAGRRFRLDVLAGLDPEFAAASAAIQKLCDLQLVDVDPTDAGRFSFRHALVRDAIPSMASPSTRRPLHAAIAAALAAREDSAEYGSEIAYHHYAAGERVPAAFARAGAAARANLDFAGRSSSTTAPPTRRLPWATARLRSIPRFALRLRRSRAWTTRAAIAGSPPSSRTRPPPVMLRRSSARVASSPEISGTTGATKKRLPS